MLVATLTDWLDVLNLYRSCTRSRDWLGAGYFKVTLDFPTVVFFPFLEFFLSFSDFRNFF